MPKLTKIAVLKPNQVFKKDNDVKVVASSLPWKTMSQLSNCGKHLVSHIPLEELDISWYDFDKYKVEPGLYTFETETE